MLLSRFHAFRRHHPYAMLKIKFLPASAKRLADTACRQNRDFQSTRGNAVAGSDLSHKRGQFLVGKRWMMLDRLYLGLSGQKVIEVPAPSRWILSRAWPRAFAQFKMRSMLARSRAAVTVFFPQTGSSTLRTRRVSMACTDSPPKTGYA